MRLNEIIQKKAFCSLNCGDLWSDISVYVVVYRNYNQMSEKKTMSPLSERQSLE